MKWLVDSLRGSRRAAQIEESDLEVPQESAQLSEYTGPRLLLLVPNSVGPYSFQLFTFPETSSATAFVESTFPPSTNNGLIAFWALHERPQTLPNEGTNKVGETVVLIRDEVRMDIAQVFSFVDMESAHSFVRLEAQNGLSLQFVSVYWTLPVAIEADGEGFVRLTPEAPDTFLREPEAEKSSEPKKVDALMAEDAAGGERDIPLDLVMIPYGGAEESLAYIPSEELETPHWSNGNELNENSAENNTERAEAEESPPDISSEEIEAPQWSNENELDEDSAENNTELAELETQIRGPKRWEVREGPFEGFGSPPGKF